MTNKSENNFLNRKYFRSISWLLLISLTAHLIVFHNLFESSVICLDEDGGSLIEYSFDGENCMPHQNNEADNSYFIGKDKQNGDCEDISFSETFDDDQFVIKNPNKSISNVELLILSLIDLPVDQSFTKVFKYFNTTHSNSIKQIKTVSLLI
jgi:hypothetical protein